MGSKTLPNGDTVRVGDALHFNTSVRGVNAGTEFIIEEIEDGVLAAPEDFSSTLGLRFDDSELAQYLEDDSLMLIR